MFSELAEAADIATTMTDPNAPWDFWAAIGTCLGGTATVFAVAVAGYQILELRRQQKGWESLKACERYDTDPILNNALKELRKARKAGTLTNDPAQLSLEIITVMNYLESLATGITQRFYVEKVIREHMEPIIEFHVNEVLNAEIMRKLGFESADYQRLAELCKKWTMSRRPWYNLKNGASHNDPA